MSEGPPDLPAAWRGRRNRHERLCLRLWAEPGKERLIVVDLGVTFPRHGRLARRRSDHGRHRPGWPTRPTGSRRSSSPTRTRIMSAPSAISGRGCGRRSMRATSPPTIADDQDGGAGPDRRRDRSVVEPRPAGRRQPGRSRCSSCRSAIRSRKVSALVIDTPAGRIVHTGDFKLDGTPLVGEPFDPKDWREIAHEGRA